MCIRLLHLHILRNPAEGFLVEFAARHGPGQRLAEFGMTASAQCTQRDAEEIEDVSVLPSQADVDVLQLLLAFFPSCNTVPRIWLNCFSYIRYCK